MGRPRSIRDLRQEYEAAEARGLLPKEVKPARKAPTDALKPKPRAQPKVKVVWLVCDVSGRTIATFDYPEKAEAEARAAALQARGKGAHFVRSDKVPMDG